MILAVDALNDTAPIWMPLVNAGGIATCLAWFMWRGERKLEDISKMYKAVAVAIERSTQASMITVIALKTLDTRGSVVIELAKKVSTDAHDAEQQLTAPDSKK